MSVWQSAARFYRNHLRHYRFVRVRKEAIFHAIGYTRAHILRPLVRAVIPAPILSRYQSLRSIVTRGVRYRFKSVAFPLLTHTEAAERGLSAEVLVAFPAAGRPCNPPSMLPSQLAEKLPALPPVETDFPPVVVHQLQSAVVAGHTNLVWLQQTVLQHDKADYSHDYTSEELHGRLHIDPLRRTVRWFSEIEPTRHVGHGVSFTDAVSANYSHWLTEVLPRLHAYAMVRPDSQATALLDAGLHANLKASIDLVLPASMPRIELATSERVGVDRLDLVSVAGYIPFDRRIRGGKGHSHGTFSAAALTSMRDHLVQRVGHSERPWPRRVLIRRSSTTRSMVNEQEVEAALLAHGFETVYPERLSFAQQVQLFQGADMVVGTTGAAMANSIFCRPDARIVICLSAHPAHAYNYWQAIAGAVGNRVHYVLGHIKGSSAPGVHSDFSCALAHLFEALELPPA
jgi:capsular polysaccharide biosynthesis protein